MNDNNFYIKKCEGRVRGSIWQCDLGYKRLPGIQDGIRPCLIVSNNKFNAYSNCYNIVTLTTQYKDSPVHLKLFKKYYDFLEADSYVECEQIHTVNINSLLRNLGSIDEKDMKIIHGMLHFQLS